MFQWQNFKSNRKKDKTNKRVIKFASELNWNIQGFLESHLGAGWHQEMSLMRFYLGPVWPTCGRRDTVASQQPPLDADLICTLRAYLGLPFGFPKHFLRSKRMGSSDRVLTCHNGEKVASFASGLHLILPPSGSNNCRFHREQLCPLKKTHFSCHLTLYQTGSFY